MAVTLIATPGSPAANSFEDVAGADAYLAGLLYAEAWTMASADEKAQALITFSRALARLAWDGWPVSSTQALPFPRAGLYDKNGWYPVDSTTIPAALKAATAEGARALLEAGQLPSTPLDTAGLKRIAAGPVTIEFTESGAPQPEWVPDEVFQLVGQWLAGYRPGGLQARLVRA
jgi:hypothetical protein